MKNRAQLVEDGKGYLKSYPKNKIFFVTSDGNFFRENDESAAKGHVNKVNKDLPKGSEKRIEYFKIERSEIEGESSGSGSGGDELIKELRAQYKELAGKNAYNGWDEEQLKAKIEELEKAN